MILNYAIGILLVTGSCQQMSQVKVDPNAGWNGGFETVKDGLPVNWLVYTAKTAGSGEFDIIPETGGSPEGTHHLRFSVKSCSAAGGRLSPGIAQERPARPGAMYRVTCKVKNSGTAFRILAGGVGAKTGEVKIVEESRLSDSEWRAVSFNVPVGAEFERLRLEVSVLSPGTFLIDDILVQELN